MGTFSHIVPKMTFPFSAEQQFYPIIVSTVGSAIAGALVVAGAESKLGSLLGPHADKITTSVGLFAVTTATMYATSLNGQARRQFQVGHPENVPLEGTKDDRIRFLNAGRGLYNLLEQAPGFFLNVWAAREIGESPILAGALLSVWSVGRILYAKNYAEKGPSGRLTGFMIATLASSAALGLPIVNTVQKVIA